MPCAGFYINLDESGDRRAEMEAELARFGMSDFYQRFPAIKGNALGFANPYLSESEIGCYTSHYLLLKANLGSSEHIHVCEDDLLFSRFANTIIRHVIEEGMIDRFDILFTDTHVGLLNEHYHHCKSLYDRSIDRDEAGAVTIFRPQIINHIAGANSYIVNRNSLGKIVDLLLSDLEAGAKLPVDITLRRLAENGSLRTGVLFPFATSVRLAHTVNSTIVGRGQHDRSAAAAWLGRQSFFIDCDLRALHAQAEHMLQIPQGDPHHDILARILAFAITDKFQPA